MCFSMSAPAVPPARQAPRTDEMGKAQSDARLRLLRARGVNANIVTSPLGLTGFGDSAQKSATLLGQTAMAA